MLFCNNENEMKVELVNTVENIVAKREIAHYE